LGVLTRGAMRVSPSGMNTADTLITQIKRKQSPIEVNHSAVAFLFVVHSTGDLKFYCPQQSPERLAMDDSQLEDDKADVIQMMKIGGRPGGKPKTPTAATTRRRGCTITASVGPILGSDRTFDERAT
jgi:hypothetical protein